MFSKSAPFTGDASQSSGFLRGPSPAPLRVGVDYHFKMIQLSATLTQLEPLNNGFTLGAASVRYGSARNGKARHFRTEFNKLDLDRSRKSRVARDKWNATCSGRDVCARWVRDSRRSATSASCAAAPVIVCPLSSAPSAPRSASHFYFAAHVRFQLSRGLRLTPSQRRANPYGALNKIGLHSVDRTNAAYRKATSGECAKKSSR
jgi:hypothetical protein